jgi:hypothetical protein
MSFWNGFFGLFESSNTTDSSVDSACSINPANGMPMVGGCGGVDIEGNPFGTDSSAEMASIHEADTRISDSILDSGFEDTSSSFDTSSYYDSSFDDSSSWGSSWDD